MVQTLSSLTFKGSIAEAITEAKQQKKLFVVYVSGDNQESNNLETSTWTNSNVADSVLKFCILLHISEGSIDASNFSTIYPQKSAPCITAIGYNGIQLWQYDGFVTADVLASSIEKAWLSLHIQETTATFLTAALASKEQPASATSNNALAEEGSSSLTNSTFSQSDTPNNPADIGLPMNSDMIHDKNYIESSGKESNSETGEQVSPSSSSANKLEIREVPEGTSCTENGELLVAPAAVNLNGKKADSHSQKENSGTGDHLSKDGEVAQEIVNGANQCSLDTNKGMVSPKVVSEGNEILEVSKHDNVVEKDDAANLTANKSNDVHLNIRLPDGSSLQVKFSVMDTLRMVKAYLNENQNNTFGSYNLAIPYPRKVFSEQDLDQSLLELGLLGRQTLIVVLNLQANSHPKGGSVPCGSNQDGPSNGSNEGYWAYMKRVLSYMNPLSYLAGTSNSSETSQESQNSTWQYGPNPSLQNNLRGAGTYPSNPSAAQGIRSDNKRRVSQRSSGFGSNIHTLRHDEDDDRFSDRNAYWNGNSTQFGGDNDGK